MKAINLASLSEAHDGLSKELFELYKSNYGISITDNEVNDLNNFLSNIFDRTVNLSLVENFFVGFEINQISKEFDLLRIGQSKIVNIELKMESTEEKIKKQLSRNRYYLSFLEKEVYNLTYVSSFDTFYYLNQENELQIVSNDFLKDILIQQKNHIIRNIETLFNVSNYLISPFNSTEKFISGQYFLTSHQEYIKNSILTRNQEDNNFISIYGAAGTGKTLLTYDIAKDYIDRNLNVTIIHCGNLNEGQLKLKCNHEWNIASVKHYSNYISDDKIDFCDLVIIDEVQRIRLHQLNSIIDLLEKAKIPCIFSYDDKQCLSNSEIRNNTPKFIKEQVNPIEHRLTKKIRTNEEIASFIRNIFNLKKTKNKVYRDNVEISYFNNMDLALSHIENLKRSQWKMINLSPSIRDIETLDKCVSSNCESAHEVIGQEYDNVVAIIDEHFRYNSSNELVYVQKTYYHTPKMLFQILTRTRKKIHLVIVNNQEFLLECINIIENISS